MRRWILLASCVAVAVSAFAQDSPSKKPANLISLGPFDSWPNAPLDGSYDLQRASGARVLAGYRKVKRRFEAFRWTSKEGLKPLGDLPGGTRSSMARGISRDGRFIVGESRSALGDEAFLWSEEKGMVGLGDLTGGKYQSMGTHVSDDGTAVAGTSASDRTTGYVPIEAFIWTQAAGMVGIGDFPGGDFYSFPTALSADGGTVYGSGGTAEGGKPFIWTRSEGFREGPQTDAWGSVISAEDQAKIKALPKEAVEAPFAYSSDRTVVVGTLDFRGKAQAYRWTKATGRQFLGDLPGGEKFSTAEWVSKDGKRVIGVSDSDVGREVYLWEEGKGLRPLAEAIHADFGADTSGWFLSGIKVYSDDLSMLAGIGERDGLQQGWVWDVEADPSTRPNPTTPPSSDPLRAEIESLYRARHGAFNSGKVAGIERMLAPDYLQTGPKGTKTGRAAVLAAMAKQKKLLATYRVASTLQEVNPDPKGAVVTVSTAFHLKQGADVTGVTRDFWVRAGTGWQLKRSRTLSGPGNLNKLAVIGL